MRAQAEAERKKLLADKSKQISLVMPSTSFETETSLSGAPITGTMTVKDMQTALKSKGCYSGKADGIWERKSKDALRNAIGSKLADRGLTAANLKAVQSSNDCIQNVRSKPKPTPNQLGSKNGTTGTKAATRHSSKQQATAGSGRRRDRPDPVALSRRYRSYILHSEGDVDINTKYGRMTCYAVTNRRICKWR